MCPVCNQNSISVCNLPSERIKDLIFSYYGLSENSGFQNFNQDFELRRCLNCTLEFASPMVAGSHDFYNFLANQTGYYPDSRWEYYYVKNHFLRKNLPLNLLDVGCGSGTFLAQISEMPGVTSQGIDFSDTAIKVCLERKIKVTKCDAHEFLRTTHEFPDIAVSFHCLEHVNNPLEFMESLKPICENGGRILTSTPYSPMSFELFWLDILNHPPHHLTRWNARSYQILAQKLNLKCVFHTPRATPLFAAAARAALLHHSGAVSLSWDKALKAREIFKNLPFFFKTCARLLTRDKINGRRAADVILVEWLKKEN